MLNLIGLIAVNSLALASANPTIRVPGCCHMLTIAAIAQFPQKGPSDEEKERNRIRIGLSKEQQSKLEALFKETGDQLQEVFKKQSEKRKELADIYKEYKYDKSRAATVQEELMQLRRQMTEISRRNEDRLRTIMKKDQFDRFQTLMQEEREKRNKERGERGRPGNRPGGAPTSSFL